MNDQEIEDGVFVPRGLLGSARYAILHKCDAPNTYAKLGEYVYPNGNTADVDVLVDADESVRAMVADRDIKVANLKTLVDMVLAYDTAADRLEDHEEGGGLDYVEIMTAYDRMVRLARGLKQ